MVCPGFGGSGGKGLKSNMENRKCLSHWRREQEVKSESENPAQTWPGDLLMKKEARGCLALHPHPQGQVPTSSREGKKENIT